jgi:ElaB/YqjD/DUF883 family membrane-anchored ribosome-binding protein
METHFEAMQPANDVSRGKIKEDIQTLLKDAEELLKITAGDMSEKARQARARLADAIANAKITCEKLEARTVAAAKATDRVIRDHPYESLGISFGIGLLLGVLISRK